MRELCAQLDIPFEVLGAEGARALARDCAGWREMSLKELRAACRLEELPTADLIEKSEFVGRLKQVRIWQEIPGPDTVRPIPTWICVSCRGAVGAGGREDGRPGYRVAGRAQPTRAA